MKPINNFKLYAQNKKTGLLKKVNIINLDQKQITIDGEEWGKWHNYSKRGDYVLFIDMLEGD